MAITDREWYLLNTAKIWLLGIAHQGGRLLENQKQQHSAMQTMTSQIAMNSQQFLVLRDLRIVEEHLFITCISKAIDWLEEVENIKPELSSDIDVFIRSFPEAKDLRNMREHDIDYFKGQGRAQSRFVKTLGNITIEGSASISYKDGYLIGGRVNVQQAMKAAEKLFPKIEKAVLAIHDID